MKYFITIALVLCLTSFNAISAVHKCKNADGGISFQETPCATEEQSLKIDNPTINIKKNERFGTFLTNKPSIADLKPSCGKDGSICSCRGSRYSYFIKGQNHYRLFDRMRELPNEWKIYNEKLKRYKQNINKKDAKNALNLAGCNILLSQMFIDTNYNKIETILIKERDKYSESKKRKERFRLLNDQLITLKSLSKKIGLETYFAIADLPAIKAPANNKPLPHTILHRGQTINACSTARPFATDKPILSMKDVVEWTKAMKWNHNKRYHPQSVVGSKKKYKVSYYDKENGMLSITFYIDMATCQAERQAITVRNKNKKI